MPKASTHLYTTCVWWMRSQLSVWCVRAVPVSGCGVGDYSSMWCGGWWTGGGNSVCRTWCDCLTALLNSSSSAVSHSSSNVDRSGRQYPWRRAGSSTELTRCRSDALVRPRHALAAYVRRRATTVARNTCCRAASSSPRVRRTRNAYRALSTTMAFAAAAASC